MQNRAYSILNIKSVDDERRIIEGIATTPEADRMGDIVETMGIEFKNPTPLLWQHHTDKPVGEVRFHKATEDGMRFTARLAKIDEAGTLRDRVDEAWQSVKAGLVRAVSIGFRAIEHSMMKDGGIRFLKSEVLELSLVTIPANASATIQVIRSIDGALLAATGHGQSDVERREKPAGGSAKSKPIKAEEAKPMTVKKTIAEQISAFDAARVAKSTRMDELMDAVAEKGETLDQAGKDEYDTLASEVKEVDEHIGRLRVREKSMITQAKPVEGKSSDDASLSRGKSPVIQVRSPSPKGSGFVRMLSARFVAKEEGVAPWEVAESKGWTDLVDVLKMPKHVIKTAIAAATTTDSTWAGPLVTYNNLQEDFIALLTPKSIISRIPGLRRVPFNVKVPRETAGTTAYWVGQGSPKPVSKGALDTVTLDFAKVAGITFQTQELLRFSRPNSEQLMIDSLTKAITYLVDRDFLDPAKAVAVGVSPASITNGSSSVASTGTGADAFRADFASLLSLYTMANYSLDGLVFAMTQTQAMRLSLMRTDFGQKEFPDLSKDGGSIEGIPVVTSENIVANGGSPADGALIAAINAPDVLLADDGAVDVDISTEASIQTDSSPDSPTTGSTVLVSLWQNNLVGIRCERFITWGKARTDSVVYITGGNYH